MNIKKIIASIVGILVLAGIGYEIYYLNSNISDLKVGEVQLYEGENIIAESTSTATFEGIAQLGQNDQTLYQAIELLQTKK